MNRPSNQPPAQPIPLNKIQYLKPPRTARDEIEKTKVLLKKHGQVNPIVVSKIKESRVKKKKRVTHPYTLHYGTTELEAARALRWPTIKAIVLDPDTASAFDNNKIVTDWVKILSRQIQYGLSNYDIAESASEMMEKWKIKASQFALIMGLSTPYTYNLMRWYRYLPNEIRSAWKKGHPLVTQGELERYAHMDPEEVLDTWKLRLRMRTTTNTAFKPGQRKNGKNQLPIKKPRRATERQLVMLQEAIDESVLTPDAKDLCSNLIKFALGFTSRVPGITDYNKLPLSLITEENRNPPS